MGAVLGDKAPLDFTGHSLLHADSRVRAQESVPIANAIPIPWIGKDDVGND
jgi:hypothetical protein